MEEFLHVVFADHDAQIAVFVVRVLDQLDGHIALVANLQIRLVEDLWLTEIVGSRWQLTETP